MPNINVVIRDQDEVEVDLADVFVVVHVELLDQGEKIVRYVVNDCRATSVVEAKVTVTELLDGLMVNGQPAREMKGLDMMRESIDEMRDVWDRRIRFFLPPMWGSF